MGSTITEKIVSRAVGRRVRAGELIEALPVDKLYFNEVIGPPAILNFQKDFADVYQEAGKRMKVFDPTRVAFMPDHTVPSCSIMVSTGIKLMADFAKQQQITMYKEGDGIEHTIASEEGFVLPGEIAVATDSHTCTQGALGALAFGIGTTEGENLLATGELYSFTVPETVRFSVAGEFQRGVYPKDLVLHVLGLMGEGGCSKRVAEYEGPTISSMEMDGRFTICNLSVEMSARTAIVSPDETTMAYVNNAVAGRGGALTSEQSAMIVGSDDDASYSQTVSVDASAIEPTVSLPHSPANAKPVSEVSDPINVVFLGSCANARRSDLTVAAKILKGRKVHPETNLIVIPASRKVYNWAMDNGILNTIAQSGANIESSNCGPCFGKHMGILAPGDRCLSTSNRNYKGRMGSPEAFIYLASPAVAAATAIEGRIADPRKYLGDSIDLQMRGTVAKKYPDDINTDYIIPAYLLQESWDKQFFADHAFEYYDPSFKASCRAHKESIVVAGNNFGCGSSREQAVYAVKYNNVVAVVAQSFPDIFYRNALNNGLLPIQVEDTSRIDPGDELLIDLEARSLLDVTKGMEYRVIATDAAVEQMRRGGFLGYVRERLRQRLRASAQ